MPKAFISYSHDSPTHKEWVLDLASRLREDGVETILDRWELEPGDQLPAFMERAVRENDFVLIICTPRYKERSDNRRGGVGFEEDVMTAEVLNAGNQKQFKPVLRCGKWDEAAPTWLIGKLYVDLTGDPYSEEQYQELLHSLHGTRPKPPPVRSTAARAEPSPAAKPEDVAQKPFESITILGVIEDEVGQPRNDGIPGCALYEVPFRFSRTPPKEWSEIFLKTWDFPPRFTTMHRPGIASIYGDRLVLDGTTIEEVARFHLDTLKGVLQETNKLYTEHLAQQFRREEVEKARRHEQARVVRDTMKRLKFD